jgi:hypothetical protein
MHWLLRPAYKAAHQLFCCFYDWPFQVENHEWHTGYITRIQNDTFYIKPMIVRYNMMGGDTLHYGE